MTDDDAPPDGGTVAGLMRAALMRALLRPAEDPASPGQHREHATTSPTSLFQALVFSNCAEAAAKMCELFHTLQMLAGGNPIQKPCRSRLAGFRRVAGLVKR
jgi:hypothetical protein